VTRYRIDPVRSRVVIDGRSTLHPIHTETDGLEGWLDLDVRDGAVDVSDGSARGHVELPVDRLRSGNPIEDKELQRRIDARRFPTITGDVEMMSHNGALDTFVVAGALTFRGVTRRYEDRILATASGDSTLAITGQSVFDIRDFGMEPPRILMLKVDPMVTVRIDVVAERSAGEEGG
jgi:polyisoprenoid-binding protein YceI